MHVIHICKVHVEQSGRDPVEDAVFAVNSRLSMIEEEMYKNEYGEDCSIAPWDYYTVVGVIDLKSGLFHKICQDDFRQTALGWHSTRQIAKGFGVPEESLYSPTDTVNNDNFGEAGITAMNCSPDKKPTHLVVLDLHV